MDDWAVCWKDDERTLLVFAHGILYFLVFCSAVLPYPNPPKKKLFSFFVSLLSLSSVFAFHMPGKMVCIFIAFLYTYCIIYLHTRFTPSGVDWAREVHLCSLTDNKGIRRKVEKDYFR